MLGLVVRAKLYVLRAKLYVLPASHPCAAGLPARAQGRPVCRFAR